MKRLFFCILLITSSVPIFSQGDITDPTFISAWFDPAITTNGGTTSLYVKAYDDLSGIQSFGAYIHAPGSNYQNIGGSFVPVGDSLYKRDIVISQWAESGTWYLNSIAIWDSAGNDFQAQYPSAGLSPATFTVNSGTPDIAEPVMDSAWFSPSVVPNGGMVSLYIKAHDDVSGVKSFGAYIQSPGGTSQNVGGSFVNIADSIYKRDIVMSQWAESGTWYLSSVAIWDSADNDFQNQYPSAGVSPATFNVNSSSPDIAEPIMASAWFSPSTIPNGGTVSVFIKAYDDVSGVSHFGAYIQSPGGTSQNIGGSFVKIADSIYTRDVVMSQYAESGTWYISSVAIWDSAGNDFQSWYASCPFSPANFNVNFATNCNITGMEENENAVRIFPNPAQGSLYIETNGLLGWRAEIFTLQGLLIYSVRPLTPLLRVSINDFPSGLYLLRITHSSGFFCRKIIIQ